jgi:hypothetical protein
MAVAAQNNNLNLDGLILRMLLAFGITIPLCLLGLYSLGFGVILLIIPIFFFITIFIIPTSILAFFIKLFIQRLSPWHSIYIALISVFLFFVITIAIAWIIGREIIFISMVPGFVIAFGTSVLLAAHYLKLAPIKRPGLILAVGFGIIAVSIVALQDQDPDRVIKEEAARLAAKLPEHREEVTDSWFRHKVPIYSKGTKITLEKDTWQSYPESSWAPYEGSAYATIDPPGKRVLVEFSRGNGGTWYIESVTDDLDRSKLAD